MKPNPFCIKPLWGTLIAGFSLGATVLLADSVKPVYDALCAAPKLQMSLAGHLNVPLLVVVSGAR
mgnify:CR=1 FL=1